MLVLVLLSVCLAAKAQDYEFNPLGRAIYLPLYDITGDLEETGTPVLLTNKIPACSVITQEHTSSESFNFFKNTESYYSSLTTSAGLSGSMKADFSLGFTLDSSTTSITGSKRTVTGNHMLIKAASYKTRVYKPCLQNPANLEKHFLADFANLPLNISRPWVKADWRPYDTFLKAYGSHVVTSITSGSSINQMAFADTSESYTERDFQVQSCMKLAGGANSTLLGGIGVSMCTEVNQSEIHEVSTMTMSDNIVVRGGKPETRNALVIHRTKELIEQFMNEAKYTNATIDYAFTSVWDILQQAHVGTNNEHTIRAINLEYYYLGFLNYGCDYKEYGGQKLQMFDFTKYGTYDEPQYECTLAPEGCHSDGDCHYKPIWCACRGSSCVWYQYTTLDTGDVKTTADPNTNNDWGWHGCNWKRGLAGSKCVCRYEDTTRKSVWSLDNKNTMYEAIHPGPGSNGTKTAKEEL